ncbi:aminotransferase class IV [Chitinophagaceae bacterium MMS25-I14]
MKHINLNGKLIAAGDAALHADNRAFRYGYGLYETMLVKDAVIELADLHWQRLLTGMLQLYFNIPAHFTAAFIAEEIIRIVRKNKLEKLCRVRLQVFPGDGGLYDPADMKPQFLIECFALDGYILALNENGLVTGIAAGLQKSNDSTANLKTAGSLIYAIAAQQAKENKWNDALICNTNNRIIESTIANVFWVKDQQVFTPPLAEGCIAGVMRNHIIKKLGSLSIPVSEKSLDALTLHQADELFLTNAIRRIKWIRDCAGTQYNQQFTRQLHGSLFTGN